VKITITIPDAAIRQAILGAHSRYWAKDLTVCADGSYRLIEHMVTHDENQWVHHRFGKAKIAKAIEAMIMKHSTNLGRLADGCCDGPDGDLLIQYACFGELKYG
jgi:hypothetical protein